MRKRTAVFTAVAVSIALAAGSSPAWAQCVTLTTPGSASTQDFNTLSSTAGSTTNNLTITGWYLTESGGGARDNEQYAVDTGGSNTGDTYSYGAAANTERALGALRSGTLISLYGACFTNNTGSTVTSLEIAYTGEQWRLGTASRTDQINFEYSLNATDLATGAWTGVAALSFTTPNTATAGAKDGNAAGNRTALSSTVSSLSIANGATFWIRWTDTDASGADDGLAVDDFSITPSTGAVMPDLTIDDVTQAEGDAGTTTFTFTVGLSQPAPPGGVTFDIATADDSATTADGDYDLRSLTTQSIAQAGTEYTFDVTVNGDTVYEPDERFLVNVTNVSGAVLTDGQGQGTITDDDATTLSIDDVTQAEGDAGTTTFTFTVSLSEPAPAGGVTFDIATADNSATTADGDYDPWSLTGQSIPATQSTYVFAVTVNGDTVYEPDEAFFVDVTNVAGTDVFTADGQGVGTITNDDTEPLVINELDYDQAGSDAAEFVEIYNAGADAIDLDPFSLVGINGSGGGAALYRTIDLPAVTLAAGDYFVVCSNPATVPFCDHDASPDTDLFQNGAPDAVALMNGARVVDTVSYEGDTGSPYTEGSGTGLVDGGSGYTGISRYPDGTDTGANNADLGLRCITPGKTNSSASSSCVNPGAFLDVVINELDADTTGTDVAEFIELFDGGTGNVPLDDLVVVLFNGGNDLSYAAYELDGYSTDGNGYFVLGNTAVAPDLVISDGVLQNGADAVALYRAGASDFPLNTAVTTTNLQDAIVYDTSDADDAGLLVLLNAAQPQVDENANAAAATQSSQRCANGAGGQRNTAGYIQSAPTAGVANFCLTGTYEIYQIQGSAFASPFNGAVVATTDNVVTAVGPQGFFIQTPDARADADPETSNGIYVFTGSSPTVAVGDQVDVAGTVQEYFDFTEFGGTLTIGVDSSGNPLPAAVTFDGANPSPDQPQPATAYERLEGVLISLPSGIVGGPSQYFGSDPTAEAFVVAGSARPFRTPGIAYPGLGGLPVWDGNPEVFEIDPDKLGLPNVDLRAGSTFAAAGVLAYEFGGYELWATSLTGVSQPPLPLPVRSRAAGELTVGSFNTLHLYDDVDDPESADNDDVESTPDYTRHLQKLSLYVRDVLGAPDILGVQEVEHLGALQALAARILADDPSVVYTAYLVEGNDVGGIDVGILVRDTVDVDAVTQLGAGQTLSVDGSLLHDRPPLLLEGSFTGNGFPFPIKVLVLHQRSLSAIEDPGDGPRVRQKRLEQAQAVAQMVQDLQTADPAVRLVVIGDFNAYEVTDGYVDVTGQIKGEFVVADNLLSGSDLVDPDLVDEVLNLPAVQRYSFVFNGTAQVLDHALTSVGIAPFVRGMQYGRGNADAPEVLEFDAATPLRCSDHDGLVLFVMSDANGDGAADDAPSFLVQGNSHGAANGIAIDDNGIQSLVLGDAVNAVLDAFGAPGDGTWSWVVRLVDQNLAGRAELIATDVDGHETRYVLELQARVPVPVASPVGLALLALLIAMAACAALRRAA